MISKLAGRTYEYSVWCKSGLNLCSRRLCAWLITMFYIWAVEYYKEEWYTGKANGLLLLRNLYTQIYAIRLIYYA